MVYSFSNLENIYSEEMATLNPLQPLQSSILEVLAKQQGLTMSDLHKELKQNHGLKVSLQNLYKAVGKMVDMQMLAKSKGKLFLNLVWLSHATHFIETANLTYNSEQGTGLPLAEGERTEFYSDSLTGLDPLWNHILMKLTEVAETHDWYVYNSHPWYSLGMKETETRLYQSLVVEGIHCHMVYGNDSFLDCYGQKMITLKGFETSIAPDAPLPKEGHALWLCGEHIVECIFPEIISRNFAFFFQTVTSVQEFDPQLFTDVFHMKARCKISVRRSKAEAKELHQKFLDSF